MKAFDKIIGYESVKKELYQIIDMFKNNELYEKMGAKIPRGVFIYGGPGMGKTMLANALIEECGVKTYVLKKDKDDKASIEEITETFQKAAKEKSSIILIDDIDKFCDKSAAEVDAESFAAIQSGIDNTKDANILVIATANNVQKLPESLTRNGRFDRRIELLTPTSEDAQKIIEFYLKDKCVDPNLNYEDVAKMIRYTSCADLATILNESAIYATYARKEFIDIEDIMNAYERDRNNAPNGENSAIDDDMRATAIHEAGHIVMAEAMKKGCVGFALIRISEYGGNSGITRLCEDFRRRPENIMMCLAGKAAVELFHSGRCASGCRSDLNKAFNLLRDGINNNANCGFGMIDFRSREHEISESMSAKSEAVIQAELERFFFMVKEVMHKNKEFLLELADELYTKHHLYYSDIQRIRSAHTVSEAYVP